MTEEAEDREKEKRCTIWNQTDPGREKPPVDQTGGLKGRNVFIMSLY